MKVTLGIGCDRGTPVETIDHAVQEALARQHGWPIHFHPAAALAAVPVPNPSETVRKHTGTPSVSEAAALLAAGADASHLLVEKHKVRGADGRHATVSIAKMPQRISE